MDLINSQSRVPLVIGDVVQTRDGEFGELTAIIPPHKPSSEGKVAVKLEGHKYESVFYASVIGCEYHPRPDRAD